ncbi:hypothetical protein [Telluribacter sp. SYSU D00476]|uniref:hypothetical protein n=1 Tax=Telluribacter sp. SYSU D00476 TaxID=2811430 RepID=UPI001FF170DA|nr:hypothetical protein [Telluribacter sp. SYSU D00476]
MKTLGIILAVVGLAMLLFGGFSYQTEEKVADIGPIEINADKTKEVAWPTYAGVIVLVAGIGLVVLDRKK